ncbi:MAG: transcription-repair coupling factor [Desulfohalobiaceae bacterium]|nr:transcription-repair coupling factor [Desulfohalobiaceae bacterium]
MHIKPEIIKTIQNNALDGCHIYKSGPGTQAMLAQALLRKGHDVVVVVPDQNTLEELKPLLDVLSDCGEQVPFWEKDWVFLPSYPQGEIRPFEWAKRSAALFSLLESRKPMGVALTLDNLVPYWPPQEVLGREYLLLMKDEEFPPEELLEKAVVWGYERVSMVTRPGELSIRGDIFDIFPPGYDYPLRMEFFGETLENIRLFTTISQRSIADLAEAIILPVSPSINQSRYVGERRDYWNHLWKIGALDKKSKIALEHQSDTGELSCWPGLSYRDSAPLKRWLPDDAFYFLVNADQIRSGLEECVQAWKGFFAKEKRENGRDWPEEAVIQSVNRARQTWLGERQVHFVRVPLGERRKGIFLEEKRFRSFQDLFWKPEQRKRPWRSLVESLREWDRIKQQTVLAFSSERSRDKFFKLINAEDLEVRTRYNPDQNGIFALIAPLPFGLDLKWNHTLLLGEGVLQPKQDSKALRDMKRDFKGLKRLDEIEADDLLVHCDYGLGRFAGLTRLSLNNVGNDYLELVYAGGDKLYVPVDRLNLVQRYKGGENASPVLDRLGSVRWSNTKKRVQKALETIAHDLVEMYAYRKVAKGYQYEHDNEFLNEFEASFAFEETPDQEQAISEVLEDMDKPEPMDRLVCGDAGFGKTEVAMRAAFKAAASGKQVAMLCPTTVLAEQHYRNFQDRMDHFSVNVAMVSRFVPRNKQKQILSAAERGTVDILIGTHRLLSKDVVLPNLGLFILDEEQRFGVRHKENLKKIRKNIDVLTLTATPIPRTLQLSLSGVRQLSVIESPPRERKEVQTSIIDRNPQQLRDILTRELDRSGQVFWVHNKVKGLERVKEFVQDLTPEARVGMAHGQMSEKVLEETMHSFQHKELDILVTTAIVESGLDFPRANTLIVDQAQMFGLGQLYQLRGRVGRSREQAYAYFVVSNPESLAEPARKRLQTILDLEFQGAGFQVAMEDLRLRGAGNILGEVQSGNINKVGLDLFLEMLEQEVRKVRGQPEPLESDPELNIAFEANIPPDYVPDSKQRLSFYKALSATRDHNQLQEWKEELLDRFGPLPEQVLNLLAVFEFKQQAAKLGVQKAELFQDRAVLTWKENGSHPPDPDKFVSWLQDNQKQVTFFPPAKLELRFEGKASIAESIGQAGRILQIRQ